MTIQASVVIWTVICFLLLVLILDRLLFRPVLELVDRRRECVRNAEKKKAEYDRVAEEYAEGSFSYAELILAAVSDEYTIDDDARVLTVVKRLGVDREFA